MDLILAGLAQQNPIPTVQQGLELIAARSPKGLTPALLQRVLNLAVKKKRADVVKWLIDEGGAEVGMVRGASLGGFVGGGGGEGGGEGVLEVLVERGWDVNAGGGGGK